MALPTTMALGSRIIFWAPYAPGASPTPGLGSQISPAIDGRILPIPPNIVSQPVIPGMVGNGPFVGLCTTPGGAAPDWVGSAAVVFDSRGQSFLVQLGINLASWQSAGSPAGIAHWSFIDLSA
jgi:hypothetical protein